MMNIEIWFAKFYSTFLPSVKQLKAPLSEAERYSNFYVVNEEVAGTQDDCTHAAALWVVF